jgi:hypothetical protein
MSARQFDKTKIFTVEFLAELSTVNIAVSTYMIGKQRIVYSSFASGNGRSTDDDRGRHILTLE